MSHWVTRRNWGRGDKGNHHAPRPPALEDDGGDTGEFVEH